MKLSTKNEKIITETIEWLEKVAVDCDAEVSYLKKGGWLTQVISFLSYSARSARRRVFWLKQILNNVDS